MTFNQKALGRLPALLALAALTLAGCGRPTGSVSGKVTYKGQPLTAGTVTFIGADQTTASSEIATDGSYTIDKIGSGLAKIGVTPPIVASGMPPGMKMDPGKMGAPSGAAAAPAAGGKVTIPEKYHDPTKSGITFEVKAGKQEFTIDLK